MNSSTGAPVQFALGTFGIMCDALRRHSRVTENTGKPRRFVLHPEVYRSLLEEVHNSPPAQGYLVIDNDGSTRLMGVLVTVDPKADRPRLVGFGNEIVYL